MSETQLIVVGDKIGVADPENFPDRRSFNLFLQAYNEVAPNARIIPLTDAPPGGVRGDQRVDINNLGAAADFLLQFSTRLGLDPSDADAAAAQLSEFARSDSARRQAAGAAAAGAAFQARAQTLSDERDAALLALTRADEARQLEEDLTNIGLREADARGSAEARLAQLAIQAEGFTARSAEAEAQLARTLEALGIQDAAALRQFGLDTGSVQGRLNTLAGVGSPITNLTQDVRRRAEDDRQRLQDIQENNERAATAARVADYGRQLQNNYVAQTEARRAADNSLLAFINLRNQTQADYDAGQTYRDTGLEYDDALKALANQFQSVGGGTGETVAQQIDQTQVDAQYELPDLYAGGAAGFGGGIFG